MQPAADLAACLALARQKGTSTVNVTPASLPGRGLGLVTTCDVSRDTVLIDVPESAMIFANRNFLKAHPVLQDAQPQAQLATFLGYMHVHQRAEYQVYSACWPSLRECQGMLLWRSLRSQSAATIRPYMPQSLANALGSATSEWTEDSHYMTAARKGYEREAEADASELDLYHWIIANTRSFSFDLNRGHKKKRSVMCPILDFMNHCSSAHGEIQYAGNTVRRSTSGYKLIAARDLKQGEEVLATYGAHDNDVLLVQYGFMLENNCDDNISLDEILLPAFAKSEQDRLRNAGYWADYTLKPMTGDVCFRTQVAVRSVILKSESWERFMVEGDDSDRDHSAEVIAWIRLHVCQYLSACQTKTSELTAMTKNIEAEAYDIQAMENILNRRLDVRRALNQWLNAHKSA